MGTPMGMLENLEADIRALLGRLIGSSDAASLGRIVMRTVGEISGGPELLALYRYLEMNVRRRGPNVHIHERHDAGRSPGHMARLTH